jgi:prephenate dehydratase
MSIVAIQGQRASFHDVAARQLIGEDIEIIPCDTFAEVFACVANGQAEYGVVATQNSIYGTIKESSQLATSEPITTLGTTELLIQQCLLALPGTLFSDIREVYSHPVALAQCQPYLAEHLPQAQLREHPDTAGSAADVRFWNDHAKASIASQAAAELYGLQVLAIGIESEKDNRTTFIAFRKQD